MALFSSIKQGCLFSTPVKNKTYVIKHIIVSGQVRNHPPNHYPSVDFVLLSAPLW